MKALGMIETRGIVGAIEAVDVMVKSANVEILGTKETGSGLVAVFIQGEVGAVKAAIDTGTESVKKIGELVSVHVIPRPSDEAMKLMPAAAKPKKS